MSDLGIAVEGIIGDDCISGSKSASARIVCRFTSAAIAHNHHAANFGVNHVQQQRFQFLPDQQWQ